MSRASRGDVYRPARTAGWANPSTHVQLTIRFTFFQRMRLMRIDVFQLYLDQRSLGYSLTPDCSSMKRLRHHRDDDPDDRPVNMLGVKRRNFANIGK